MDKFEKLVLQLMKEFEADGEPITREEAEEMAKMELNADTRYEKAEEKKERKPRERKVDDDKKTIIQNLYRGLTLAMDSTTITIENENKLHFEYNGSEYTVTLTKHRKK